MKANAQELLNSSARIKARLEDLIATLPSLKKQTEDVFANLPQSLGGVFGDAVRQWDGTFKGLWQSVEKGFGQMLLNIAGDLVQSEATKIIAGLEDKLFGIGKKKESPASILGGAEFAGQDFSGLYSKATVSTTANTQSVTFNTVSTDQNTVAIQTLTQAIQQEAMQTNNLASAMQASHGASAGGGGFWRQLLGLAIGTLANAIVPGAGSLIGGLFGGGGSLWTGPGTVTVEPGPMTPIATPIHRAFRGRADVGNIYEINEGGRREFFKPDSGGDIIPLAQSLDYAPNYSRMITNNYGPQQQQPIHITVNHYAPQVGYSNPSQQNRSHRELEDLIYRAVRNAAARRSRR
jgi:hypothetical protein